MPLQISAFRARLGKPRGQHHERPGLAGHGLRDHVEHPSGGDGHHDEVDVGAGRQVQQCGVAGAAEDRFARAVDRVQGAGKTTLGDVAENLVADSTGPGPRADDGHRAGPQQPVHGPPIGRVAASVDGVNQDIGRVDREGDLNDADVDAMAGDAESRGPEHVQHRPVLGQCVGHEAADSPATGGDRQVFEQQRPETPVVILLGYHEGNLGLAVATGGVVAADGYQCAVGFDHECQAVVVVHDGESIHLPR